LIEGYPEGEIQATNGNLGEMEGGIARRFFVGKFVAICKNLSSIQPCGQGEFKGEGMIRALGTWISCYYCMERVYVELLYVLFVSLFNLFHCLIK